MSVLRIITKKKKIIITPGEISVLVDWLLSQGEGYKLSAGPLARRWCNIPKTSVYICMKHLTLIKVRTADPAWLLHNISVYKSRPWKIKNWDKFLERLVSPCLSLFHSGWVSIWSAEPVMLTNYAWASKIRPWRPQYLLSFGRMEGRLRPTVSGANFLSWSFIGLPRKPSYSASFLHWIFLLSYPHFITLCILN